MRYDIIIIGAGIVGAAVAWQLRQRYPDKKIAIIEKEARPALHQTGRNSGVIHAGVYYQPGSMKADFCQRGLLATIKFARAHHIPYEQCGKLLVATSELELQRLQALNERCQINGIVTEVLSAKQLQEKEPAIKGLGAINASRTGIVDYTRLTECMLDIFTATGGAIEYGRAVKHITESDTGVSISTSTKLFACDYLIACGGLHADTLARQHGLEIGCRVIPVRGEYYKLHERHSDLVKQLIYPIPDPKLPFLGVHITRMIHGEITVGPNAVLGWQREGYGKCNFKLADSMTTLTWPGFWRLAAAQTKAGLQEQLRSLSKRLYLQQLHRFTDRIELSDLQPWPTGVRAQAVLRDGSLVDDFLFSETSRSLHVCHAPSPAATSAIPVSEYICDTFSARLQH